MSTIEEAFDLKPLEQILSSWGLVELSDLIPILYEIQDVYGYLPPAVLTELSEKAGIPVNRIYGVVTFYEQFHLEPHGRHTIRCCTGTACHVKGGANISRAIKQVTGIEPGQTTEDMRFTFETVACLGTCFLAPVMMVNNDYYGHLTANKIETILEAYS